MGKKQTSWNTHYFNQQISAMRWLVKQGLSPVEIRTFRWGAVDETTKTIAIRSKMFFIRYNRETGIISRTEDYKEVKTPIPEDRELRHFFLKSKYMCPWMFTATPPQTWRKEESKSSLFPLEVVENYCQEVTPIESSSVLTNLDNFATIKISKLNITKLKTQEPIKEAKVIKS